MNSRSSLARAAGAVFVAIVLRMSLGVAHASEPSAELTPADDGASATMSAVGDPADATVAPDLPSASSDVGTASAPDAATVETGESSSTSEPTF
jgi:hypothetical protein